MAERSPHSEKKNFRLSAQAKDLAVDVINLTRKHIDNSARRIRDRIQDETLNLLTGINRANECRDAAERLRQQEAAKGAAMNLAHLLTIANELGYISLTSCNSLGSRAAGIHTALVAWINSDKARQT